MSALKTIAKWIVPKSIRPSQLLGPQIRARTHGVIHSGPFAGMKYLPHSYYNLYYPKLLGTYEKELAPAIEALCAAAPEMIIDVGAAEGYFAVGLARRLPKTRIIAFEAVESERDRLKEMCSMNQVSEQVEIHGSCEVKSLSDAMARTKTPFIICDVEGYEEVLLQPQSLANCENATFLVEVHPFTNPNLEAELIRRFSPTHHCESIMPVPRKASEYPFPTSLSRALPAAFSIGPMHEYRPTILRWLHITPKR